MWSREIPNTESIQNAEEEVYPDQAARPVVGNVFLASPCPLQRKRPASSLEQNDVDSDESSQLPSLERKPTVTVHHRGDTTVPPAKSRRLECPDPEQPCADYSRVSEKAATRTQNTPGPVVPQFPPESYTSLLMMPTASTKNAGSIKSPRTSHPESDAPSPIPLLTNEDLLDTFKDVSDFLDPCYSSSGVFSDDSGSTPNGCDLADLILDASSQPHKESSKGSDSDFDSTGNSSSGHSDEVIRSSAHKDAQSGQNSLPEPKDETAKPSHSYIELIAKAIMSAPGGRILLGDIYSYIQDNFPYYQQAKPAWRNSIRHNLSVNECFMKNGRARNGRGFYWSIHPACMADFKDGDFNRRQSRRRVQLATKAMLQASQQVTSPPTQCAAPSLNQFSSPISAGYGQPYLASPLSASSPFPGYQNLYGMTPPEVPTPYVTGHQVRGQSAVHPAPTTYASSGSVQISQPLYMGHVGVSRNMEVVDSHGLYTPSPTSTYMYAQAQQNVNHIS